jgi:hypothetical protein
MNRKIEEIDLKEGRFREEFPEVLEILLIDRTSKKNLTWGTNNYEKYGKGFFERDFIEINKITGRYSKLIRPRVLKSTSEQKKRSKDKAEVFTPSWLCNQQNNLIDEKWFGYPNPFNITEGSNWKSVDKVIFVNKSFKEYILENRIEITCGEAPYLVSRYDTTNGEVIDLKERIGFLDRKLRIISENIDQQDNWFNYSIIAFQSIYGYDFQGDNVLLSRENLLVTFIDYYFVKFNEIPSIDKILKIAEIISWNIWQMDGLNLVVPNSCKIEEVKKVSLFPEYDENPEFCKGCKNSNILEHNGQYCLIKDWPNMKTVKFVNLLDGGINELNYFKK